jgi:cation transport ATPase
VAAAYRRLLRCAQDDSATEVRARRITCLRNPKRGHAHPGRILRGVAIIGTLAIVGFLLLVAQFLFGGALNTATHDSPFVFVPLALGLICLWVAFWRGLAKGPAAIRLAVLCGFGSLVLFGYSVMAIYTSYFSRDVFLAGSAALFVLAITLGIFSYTNERAASHKSSAQE